MRWRSRKISGKTVHYPLGSGRKYDPTHGTSKVYVKEVKQELREHPWATKATAERIVQDHMAKPSYSYEQNATGFKNIPVSSIVFNESSPVDLDRRAKYFMNMHRKGEFIPPIAVVRSGGKYVVVDGHARVEAYRKLGIKNIPAVVMPTAGG